MIFILIRIWPFLTPILYGLFLKLVFIFNGQMVWFMVAALALNFLYFLFIFIKKKKIDIFIFLLHASILILVGFAYVLILSSQTFINLFIIIWSLLYFLYLESFFHYFYKTQRVLLLDLKNVMAYINLIAFFLLVTFLINLYIFINFSTWLVFLLIGVSSFLLILSRLKVNNIIWSKSFSYAFISTLLIIEVLAAVLFLSVSFYVSAVILTILYYILNSFLVLSAQGNLTQKIVWQYLGFTFLAIFIISITSQWL